MTKKRTTNQVVSHAAFSAWQKHNLAAITQRLLPFQHVRSGVLFEHVSAYNHIIVRRTPDQLLLCYRHQRSPIEEVESRLNPLKPLALPSAYTQAMILGLVWQPQPQRILLLGLGGGRLQMILHHYLEDVSLTTVELDPVIVEVAERFFGFAPDQRQRVLVQDGREYVQNGADGGLYDLILLDAFQVEGVPRHLSTQEFYHECRSCLAPGGIIATNLHSGTPEYDSARKTFEASFAYTVAFPLIVGNVVMVGSDTAPLSAQDIQTKISLVEQRFLSHISLSRLAQARTKRFAYRRHAPILHDAYRV